MSAFRVNTNGMAMNALRNLANKSNDFAKSIERLSSGLRINTAADDPAGLTISESFRAQIASIESALRNNQDAANFVKTAEGSLDEVNSLLRTARQLATASSSAATLSDAQKQANQNQLNSIAAAITRIAQTTAFGTRKMLDGSSGVTAASTSVANATSVNFSSGVVTNTAGTNFSITGNGIISLQVTQAATKANYTGTNTFASTASLVNAGSFTLNGQTFTFRNTDSVQSVLEAINLFSDQIGVVASHAANVGITLRATSFGSDGKVHLIDTNGILSAAGTTSITAGLDAQATGTIAYDGTNTVSFSMASGKGTLLKDINGNTIQLTEAGNTVAAAAARGYISVLNAAQFQMGPNGGDNTVLALGNFAANNLGIGAVSGKHLGNLDLTSASGAVDAIKVIDKAATDITEARGRFGAFQRYIVESNLRSLTTAKENLSASESAIRDTDIAEEMTVFSKLQILQQAGISVLAQANAAPQRVLALLQG